MACRKTPVSHAKKAQQAKSRASPNTTTSTARKSATPAANLVAETKDEGGQAKLSQPDSKDGRDPSDSNPLKDEVQSGTVTAESEGLNTNSKPAQKTSTPVSTPSGTSAAALPPAQPAAKAVTSPKPQAKNLVADTISSIVSLFGERKKKQMVTTPVRPNVSRAATRVPPAPKPTARQSAEGNRRQANTPTSASLKSPGNPNVPRQPTSPATIKTVVEPSVAVPKTAAASPLAASVKQSPQPAKALTSPTESKLASESKDLGRQQSPKKSVTSEVIEMLKSTVRRAPAVVPSTNEPVATSPTPKVINAKGKVTETVTPTFNQPSPTVVEGATALPTVKSKKPSVTPAKLGTKTTAQPSPQATAVPNTESTIAPAVESPKTIPLPKSPTTAQAITKVPKTPLGRRTERSAMTVGSPILQSTKDKLKEKFARKTAQSEMDIPLESDEGKGEDTSKTKMAAMKSIESNEKAQNKVPPETKNGASPAGSETPLVTTDDMATYIPEKTTAEETNETSDTCSIQPLLIKAVDTKESESDFTNIKDGAEIARNQTNESNNKKQTTTEKTKQRKRKSVEIIKTFPLRNRKKTQESPPEQPKEVAQAEEDGSDASTNVKSRRRRPSKQSVDEKTETPAPQGDESVKDVTQNDSLPATDTITPNVPMKKRRGRQPRASVEPRDGNSSSSLLVVDDVQTDKPALCTAVENNTEESPAMELDTLTPSNPLGRRGRGRTARNQSASPMTKDTECTESSLTCTPNQRKSDTPKSGLDSPAQITPNDVVKKRRGRPARTSGQPEEPSTPDPTNIQESPASELKGPSQVTPNNPVKRKRGRPPWKNIRPIQDGPLARTSDRPDELSTPDPTNIQESPASELKGPSQVTPNNPVKRKRGRPPWKNIQPVQDTSAPTTVNKGEGASDSLAQESQTPTSETSIAATEDTTPPAEPQCLTQDSVAQHDQLQSPPSHSDRITTPELTGLPTPTIPGDLLSQGVKKRRGRQPRKSIQSADARDPDSSIPSVTPEVKRSSRLSRRSIQTEEDKQQDTCVDPVPPVGEVHRSSRLRRKSLQREDHEESTSPATVSAEGSVDTKGQETPPSVSEGASQDPESTHVAVSPSKPEGTSTVDKSVNPIITTNVETPESASVTAASEEAVTGSQVTDSTPLSNPIKRRPGRPPRKSAQPGDVKPPALDVIPKTPTNPVTRRGRLPRSAAQQEDERLPVSPLTIQSEGVEGESPLTSTPKPGVVSRLRCRSSIRPAARYAASEGAWSESTSVSGDPDLESLVSESMSFVSKDDDEGSLISDHGNESEQMSGLGEALTEEGAPPRTLRGRRGKRRSSVGASALSMATPKQPTGRRGPGRQAKTPKLTPAFDDTWTETSSVTDLSSNMSTDVIMEPSTDVTMEPSVNMSTDVTMEPSVLLETSEFPDDTNSSALTLDGTEISRTENVTASFAEHSDIDQMLEHDTSQTTAGSAEPTSKVTSQSSRPRRPNILSPSRYHDDESEEEAAPVKNGSLKRPRSSTNNTVCT